MSTMNITIIIPALQLPPLNNNGHQHHGTRRGGDMDSPQPTTPFPPINLSPSPTPSCSSKNSYTPASFRLGGNVENQQVRTTSHLSQSSYKSITKVRRNPTPIATPVISKGIRMSSSMAAPTVIEESYDKFYQEDPFIPVDASASPQPPIPQFRISQDASSSLNATSTLSTHFEEQMNSLEVKDEMDSLMHDEEVTVSESQDFIEDIQEDAAFTSLDGDVNSLPYELPVDETPKDFEAVDETADLEYNQVSAQCNQQETRYVEESFEKTQVSSMSETRNVFEEEDEEEEIIDETAEPEPSPQKCKYDEEIVEEAVTEKSYDTLGSEPPSAPDEPVVAPAYENQESQEMDLSNTIADETVEDETDQGDVARHDEIQETDQVADDISTDNTLENRTLDNRDSLEGIVMEDTISVDTLLTGSSPETVIHSEGPVPLEAAPHDSEQEQEIAQPSQQQQQTEKPSTPVYLDSLDDSGHQQSVKHGGLMRQDSVDSGSDHGHDSLSGLQPDAAKVTQEPHQITHHKADDDVLQHSGNNSPAPSDQQEKPDNDALEEEEVPEETVIEAKAMTLRRTPSIITTPASAQGHRSSSKEPEQYGRETQESPQHASSDQELEKAESAEMQDANSDNGNNTCQDNDLSNTNEESTNEATEDEPLLSSHAPILRTSTTKKRTKSSAKKTKLKTFPNPRKPSTYPQRTNKVTLARQALAREKRRVYVEERIQSYIKNAQANNLPILSSLPLALSSETETGGPGTATDSALDTPSVSVTQKMRRTRSEPKHHQLTSKNSSSSHPRPKLLTRSMAQTTISSNEEIVTKHLIRTSTVATETCDADFEDAKQLFNETQTVHSEERNTPSEISLPPLSPITMSHQESLNSNLHPEDAVMSLTSPLGTIQVARVHSNNHHRRNSHRSSHVLITPHPSQPSHPHVPLPIISMSIPDLSYKSEPQDSHNTMHSIFAMPSNPNDLAPAFPNKALNGVEHYGYFYSFRVRQQGPVQMFDKSVQAGDEEPEPIVTHPPSHSYTLKFSETHSSNSSYIVSTKNENTYPISSKESEEIIQETSEEGQDEPVDRDKILREISETVQLRHDAELRRSELVQRANDLQTRVKEKRDKINRRHEFWHKKYIEESSLTRPLEASCSSLRAELNTVHRRLLAHLEGRDLPLRLRDGPSKKANYKIMAARLQHEIKELQQKVKSAKLRLESEIKLKEQADREVREIRNDLSHKKVIMSLARSQVSTLPTVHSRSYDSLVY